MKYFKLSFYELSAIAILLFAVIVRFVLIAQGWPLTNSDEDTMGLMARHIAYQGEHPSFFYGQNYMGAVEAYVGAVLFHLFGASLFSLRLGLLLIFFLFLLSMYLLTSMLYSKGLALVTTGLLGLGSSYVMMRELSAIGGYPETLLLGALVFLFASWLAISYQSEMPWRKWRWRLVAYSAWGLAAGLGLYSDLLIAPYVLMSGVLIVCVCWRELLRVVPALCMLLGLVIGAFPLIYYNLSAPPDRNSLTILQFLENNGQSGTTHTLAVIIMEIKGTLGVSIPLMTGNPFCPVTEVAFLGPTSPHSLACTLIRSSWGVGYLLLLVIALLLTLGILWRVWRKRSDDPASREMRVRYLAGSLLLLSACLSLVVYAHSAAPIVWPGIHGRYLIGLLIATPAVIWPLWHAITRNRPETQGSTRVLWRLGRYASAAILAALAIILLTGTVLAFGEVPSVQASNQHDLALARDLSHIGIRHIYTDYWTCDKIAFVSDEQIICGVVDGQLHPSHNRYMPYYITISSDPLASYVFPANSFYVVPTGSRHISPVEQTLQQMHRRYRRIVMEGYIIYQPL